MGARVPVLPWEYDVDDAAARLLERAGWNCPDRAALPTGAELVASYLAPLAATPQLAPRIRTRTRVLAVSREGMDKTRSIGRAGRPYVVRTVRDGVVTDVRARAVLDASGTWGRSNPLGAAGLPAIGEEAAGPWLTGPLPDVLGRDRARFAGRRTLVVGMGHSAAGTLLALVRLRQEEPGTRITWAIRGRSPARLYGGGDADGLPARGLLGSQLRRAAQDGTLTLVREAVLTALAPETGGDGLAVSGRARDHDRWAVTVDALVPATGFRPDLDLLREIRLDLDPALEAPARLAPLIDPNHHSCGTVPPHGEAVLAHPDEAFYVVGMKSYGRAPTFLLATGYEQVRSIAAALAGDTEGAEQVRLHLPATGACSTGLADAEDAEDGAARGFVTGTAHGRSSEAGPLAACCGSTAAATSEAEPVPPR